MKVLLGTDLLIYYLQGRQYVDGIHALFRWCSILNVCKVIDISAIAIATNFSKINTFKDLDEISDEVLKLMPPKTSKIRAAEIKMSKDASMHFGNRLIKERALLAQLNILDAKKVDFLITENIKTINWAKFLDIDDRVYTIEGFIEKCVFENRDSDSEKGAVVRTCRFGDLSIKDTFFKTFINEYGPYYPVWFRKKADDIVYVSEDDNNIIALLKLKLEDESEDYSDIKPLLLPARRLKVCSFKVSYTGSKLGERFMRIIFDEALRLKVDEIYLTIFDNSIDRLRLINIIERWGFRKHGKKNKQELVYVRKFHKTFNRSFRKSFPYHPINSAFIVPLHKSYAMELVPSASLRKDKKDIEPYKRAIRKVLVLHNVNSNQLKTGTILLFYQKTHEIKERGITAIGIVENVFTSLNEYEQFLLRCRKRSTLNDQQLIKCWESSINHPIVINFLYNYSFGDNIISSSELELAGIDTSLLKNQICCPISQLQFREVIKGTIYEKDIIVY